MSGFPLLWGSGYGVMDREEVISSSIQVPWLYFVTGISEAIWPWHWLLYLSIKSAKKPAGLPSCSFLVVESHLYLTFIQQRWNCWKITFWDQPCGVVLVLCLFLESMKLRRSYGPLILFTLCYGCFHMLCSWSETWSRLAKLTQWVMFRTWRWMPFIYVPCCCPSFCTFPCLRSMPHPRSVF